VTALSIYDEESGRIIGYITLSSINHEITKSGGRVKSETVVQ
jgi:hypothetical protein